jgi:integrase
VKLPKRVTEEANPPSDEHFLAIIETLLPRWRLFFLTIEQGGLRIGEAVALRWGDVDVARRAHRLALTSEPASRLLHPGVWAAPSSAA